MAKVEVNPRLIEAQYAVRGAITNRAQEIQADFDSGKNDGYDFDEVIYCNIGNPQQLNQQPLTYNRQVMALVDAPFLLDNEKVTAEFPKDVVARAREMVKAIGGPNKTGAYTMSNGYPFVRKHVAEMITSRDRKASGKADLPESDAGKIFLTDGASTGVKMILQVIIGVTSTDSLMIPLPQYPLYTALLPLIGGAPAPYYLDEDKGWGLTLEELERSYKASVDKGEHPRGIVIINPGNPTGQILDASTITDILTFANQKNLVVIADEVYQENIYAEGKSFHSFREMLLLHSDAKVRDTTALVSLHTTSKGIIGECGRRGGYAEFMNFTPDVFAQITKIASMGLCSNVNGQIMTDLMVKPPQKGEESYESFWAEYNAIFESLRRRAILLHRQLNNIPGLKCNVVEGSMYGYASIDLPQKWHDHVKAQNEKDGTKLAADFVWAISLLNATGIVVVPGSGFGQKEGTFHFRTTILPPEPQMEAMTKRMLAFQEKFMKTYAS